MCLDTTIVSLFFKKKKKNQKKKKSKRRRKKKRKKKEKKKEETYIIRSSRRYPLLKLLRKHGSFSKQPIKEPRLSKIQNFRGLLRASKRLI